MHCAGRWCALALLAVSAAVAGCGREAPARPIAYRGQYHYGPDVAYLAQTGVEARICLEGVDMTPAIQPEFLDGGGRSEVVVRGVLSARGAYGPDGICAYRLTDTELLGVGDRLERD